MNRQQRRERKQFSLQAVTICERCGSPICPRCEVEATWCPGCGGYHCERCGNFVDPVPRSH